MSTYTSVIDEIWRAAPGLHAAERRVAEAVLADIDAATRMTTKELSGLAGVSEPTVVRFARRMGSGGFTDFKLRLSQDFAVARMFVLPQHASLAGDAKAVASQVYEATAQALAYSFAQRNPAALERASEALHAARRVFCMGVGGGSAAVAEEAENRLFRFDVAASAIIDPYRQRIAAALCGQDDVLLIFSVTGRPHSLVDSARLAAEAGAVVVVVTRPGSPLAEAGTILIPLDVPDHRLHFEMPNRSRYGQLYILDCLATLLGAQRLEASAARLRRARRR